MPYYGVSNGRQNGVYNNWNEASRQVDGYSNAQHQKFDNFESAHQYVNGPTPSSQSEPGRFYGVANGRQPGVYNSWNEASRQVDGYSGAKHQKFDSYNKAENFVSTNQPQQSSSNSQRNYYKK